MDYYKILNKDEWHYDMQYKTGENVDVLPFNPSGNCKTGGIYFSREDILAFLNYGCWIRKVTIPDGEPVYENPGLPKKWKAHRVILGEREEINDKVIERLIQEGADVHADDDLALRWASGYGHLAFVKVLLVAGADVHADNDLALQWASSNRHLKLVALLKSYMK